MGGGGGELDIFREQGKVKVEGAGMVSEVCQREGQGEDVAVSSTRVACTRNVGCVACMHQY